MRIKITTSLILFLAFYLIVSESAEAQDINVNLNTVDSLITTNTENLVFDVNGELCSMVIMTTALEGLKFYSNLGVEKIIKTENGYRIWLPNQANVMKFIIPGFPLFEYLLPRSAYRYSVYIISLNIESHEKIVLRDTLKPSLSISTFPSKAKIWLNGWYLKKSPVIIKEPVFMKFEYTIKKKGYSTYSSSDTMDRKTKNITVELTDLHRSKRYFLIPNIKVDAFSKSPKRIDDQGVMTGITFGIFGKTGFFGSLSIMDAKKWPSASVYYSNYTRYTRARKLSVSLGVSQQLLKSLFIYGGPGYINRIYMEKENPSFRSESVNLNAGIILRLGWRTLLQFDYARSITNSYSTLGFGFGFNFSKKTTNQTNQQSMTKPL